MKSIQKSSAISRLTLFLSATTAFYCVDPAYSADQLPSGASVVAGTAAITQSGKDMQIRQNTDRGIINWNSFNIGSGNRVLISQPNAGSALLNRVTGNTSSTIAGQLSANGQVYLVNPHGIAITPTGNVKVGGGFLGSSLDIRDQDFMAGKLQFKGKASPASVSNNGVISVGRGGYAALLGGKVRNSGLISVPMGKVGLGSGQEATLDLSGDGFLQVAIPTKSGTEDDGALIENDGTISADGGTLVMRAATARKAVRNAINLSGVAEARSVSGRNGVIVLGGGSGGRVKISGKVNTSAQRVKLPKTMRLPTMRPATIEITGQHIQLAGADIDASNDYGASKINIGGGYQGRGPLQRADTVTADAKTTIKANALTNGNGGDVVIWSDQTTEFAGRIIARGVGDNGRGGNAEVSGKKLLSYTGYADLKGDGGFGTLLLDPYNVTIANAAQSGITGGFTASGNDSVVNVGVLQTQLGAANVTVSTGAGGSQTGNLTLADSLTWASGSTLTLSAAGDITFKASLTANNGGKLALEYGQSALATNNTARYHVNAPINLEAGQNFSTKLGSDGVVKQYQVITQLGADGSTTATDLQGINGNLGGNYVLGANIDASATANWRGGRGFQPLKGVTTAATFGGVFDGLGHTIDNLTIKEPTSGNVGLFGRILGATIQNVGLTNVDIQAGGGNTGGLVGDTSFSTIRNAFTTGTVHSTGSTVGGLIGFYQSRLLLENSYSTANVSSTSRKVGGLIGNGALATGVIIRNSYATGNVSGTRDVGGFAGSLRDATVENSYATGNVSSTGSSNRSFGSFAGIVSSSTFTNTYASGTLNVAAGATSVGGFVGKASGTNTFNNSFWNSETSGRANAHSDVAGNDTGLTALTNAQFRQLSTFTGANWDIDSTGGTGKVWRIYDGHTAPLLRSFMTQARLTPDYDGSGNQMTNIASYSVGNGIDTNQILGTAGTSLRLSAPNANEYRAALDLSGLYSTQTGYDIIGGDRTISTPGTAPNAISLSNGVRWTNGALHIDDNVTNAGEISSTNGVFQILRGNWRQTGTLPTFSVRDFQLSGGTFLRAKSGDGQAATPYLLSDIYGLQGMTTLPTSSFALEHDVDASSARHWNSGAGFDPIGKSLARFQGSFDGRNHKISNVTINRPTQNDVGFFGSTSGATIKNIGLTRGSITGRENVGALIGAAFANTQISETSSTANVTGTLRGIGGLIGTMDSASVSNSYASGAVNGPGTVGGLIGAALNGSVTNSYASGRVTGTNNTAGLIGSIIAFGQSITSSGLLWDTQTTNQANSHTSLFAAHPLSAQGVTSADAFKASTYANLGWDISNSPTANSQWYINEGVSHPTLRAATRVFGGGGTKPNTIGNAANDPKTIRKTFRQRNLTSNRPSNRQGVRTISRIVNSSDARRISSAETRTEGTIFELTTEPDDLN